MAAPEGSDASASRKPVKILSRDDEGNEHQLHVADHPAGLISINDDEMVRIMAPDAAVALVAELLHALGNQLGPAH